MEYNNYELYFGIFNLVEVEDFKTYGVNGGQLLTEEAVENLCGSYSCVNTDLIFSYEDDDAKWYEQIDRRLFVWLGHADYIYQNSIRKISLQDLKMLAKGLHEEPIATNHKYFPKGKHGIGHVYNSAKHHYKNSYAKELGLIEDGLKYGVKYKASRLKRDSLYWDKYDGKYTTGGNGWKDNTKVRKQYLKNRGH